MKDMMLIRITCMLKMDQRTIKDVLVRLVSLIKWYEHMHSLRCPFRILDTYFSKLPSGKIAFYMQPMMSKPTRPWFKKTPVGVNTLMSKISELAGLPVKYTNHSVRAT